MLAWPMLAWPGLAGGAKSHQKLACSRCCFFFSKPCFKGASSNSSLPVLAWPVLAWSRVAWPMVAWLGLAGGAEGRLIVAFSRDFFFQSLGKRVQNGLGRFFV